MAIEASRNALRNASVSASQLGALWIELPSSGIGTELSFSTLAEVLGTGDDLFAAGVKSECSSASTALQTGFALVGFGMAKYALTIGFEVASRKKGEDAAQAVVTGIGAFVLGPGEEAEAVLERWAIDGKSTLRDHAGQQHRLHGQAESAGAAAVGVMNKLELQASDIDMALFLQPTARPPRELATTLGVTPEQVTIHPSVARGGCDKRGSLYVGLSSALDVAKPEQRILCVLPSRSSAGSCTLVFRTTSRLHGSHGREVVPASRIANSVSEAYQGTARVAKQRTSPILETQLAGTGR